MRNASSIIVPVGLLSLTVIAACVQLIPGPEPQVKQRTEVIAANVGPGQCILIKCPNGARILHDCGSLDGEHEQSAIDLIKTEIGVNNPLYVVISHADRDHYSLIPQVAIPGIVKALYYSGDQNQYGKYDMPAWLAGLSSKIHKGHPPIANLPDHPDQNIACMLSTKPKGGTYKDGVYVLAYNSGKTKNDGSLVLKLVQGPLSVTIMGDSEQQTEGVIEARYKPKNPKTSPFLPTTLLVAAHHGSDNNANSQEWANIVTPNAVIYSAGNRANYAHPRCDVLTRYENAKALDTATPHAVRCWEAQGEPKDQPAYAYAQVNTWDYSSAIRFVAVDDQWSLEVCPQNVLKCTVVRQMGK